jgi:hypothetical protein
VVNGINAFLRDQRALDAPASIALVRFDSQAVERFRPMGPLAEACDMQMDEFAPRGGTPLLDAVGRTIVAMEDDWKREQPEQAIMVIVTDGQENASCEFTKAKVKEMIEARQASGKWAFVYLGANVDAFAEASGMGISVANAAGYNATPDGVRASYATASASVSGMRATGNLVAGNLGGKIEDDGSVTRAASPQPAAVAAQPWTPPAAGAGSQAWTPPA